MTTPTPPTPPTRPDLDEHLALPESTDPKAAAREQFIHGLLETLHRDTPADAQRRIDQVLTRLESPLRAPRRWPWRFLSGLAAALAITTLVILGTQTGSTALAMVQASIEASKTAGDRRYKIDVSLVNALPDAVPPRATLDVRDPDHYVIEAFSSYGDQITLGRDSAGDWAIKLSGEIDRFPPRHLLNQWVSFGQATLMLVAIDDLLGTLAQSYTLKRLPSESLGGISCNRISAARGESVKDGPDRVELWLDPASHIVRRAELLWDNVSGSPPARPPTDDRPPRDRRDDARDGPPPGPPPDDLGPPPPPPGESGTRPDHPHGGRRPQFLPAPPDRRYTAPPGRAVFELTEGPKLPENWFAPEPHARPQSPNSPPR